MASHRKSTSTHKTCLQVTMLVVMLFVGGQGGYELRAKVDSAWKGESGHASLNFGLGSELSFTDFPQPFFNSTPVSLILSSSFTQQYSLLATLRQKDPLHIGWNNRYKYIEMGFGINVLHRANQGQVWQQTQVIMRADSSVRSVSAVREVEVSNLSVGVSGVLDMPTYLINKLRVRLEPYVNIIVWDKSRNELSLSENDTSVILPNYTDATYSNNGRIAKLERSGERTFGMIYSIKVGISYSFLILLRETPWLHETRKHGEIQPYINYTLSLAPTLTNSHRAISGFQIGVRFTIPDGVLDGNEADYIDAVE